jgi:hypothetical protein
MQNRRSLESGSQSELEDVCRGKVATRCFIEAGWGIYARADYVAKQLGRTAAGNESSKSRKACANCRTNSMPQF